jgi:hypothetical protein
MDGLGALLLVAAVFVANFPAVITQWRTDRPGAIKTVWMSGLYLLYVGLGIALLLLLVPGEGGSEDKSFWLTGLMVGWIFYGALTLMRLVPRYREPPRWMMHFGIADLTVLGLMAVCLGGYSGA